MGLDMRPMGRPKPGFENRFAQILDIVKSGKIHQPSFLDKIFGKKYPTKEELVKEWLDNQIPTYETIKAPKVGRDEEADIWLKERYNESDKNISFDDFAQEYQDYYVIELAKEVDGVPVYISLGQDENVFRGQFLEDCYGLIAEDLINEAWETKMADATLDYGNRLMIQADKIAKENNLEYLKLQRLPPETDETTIESKLHIIFSLAKWLIFYGKNGHGYEADF